MRRDGAAAEAEAAERQRAVRERLDATGSGLAELELLRQRQEELVRAALEEQEERKEAPLSAEEKLLEENILLLRKQLNCLRRRDAGLISQLQELDRQISDLRLDSEEPQEPDSRPSSGFYELSDGASCSLSNSSNSVFSECFCSAEADGRLAPADEPAGCLECAGSPGGLWDDSSSCGTVRRSLSAPHPAGMDSCDSQSRYHCDLVARKGGDVYRYPSPLHAVAVQSPDFLQMLGPGRDDGPVKNPEGPTAESLPASVSAPLMSQSCSWPAPCSSSSSSASSASSASSSSSLQMVSQRRLDSYILGLLQRRALPVRPGRPRTSISTDPSKSVLRPAGLCARQPPGSGSGTLRGADFKPSWPTGGADGAASPPQRSVESKSEELENRRVFPERGADGGGRAVTNRDFTTSTNSLLRQSRKLPATAAMLPRDMRELGSPRANSSPKEAKPPSFFPDQEFLKSPAVIKTSGAAGRSQKPPQTAAERVGRSAPESVSLGSSSPHQGGEGAGSHTENVPAQRQNIKLRKAASKTAKVKTTTTARTSRLCEHKEAPERRADTSQHRSGSKKSRWLDDGGSVHVKVSKRAAGGGSHGASCSRTKRLTASIPEGRVLDRNATSTPSSVRSGASRHHHHHHGRDQVVVVAKPKHKRNDYRRLRAIMEVPYDEAFRRAQRRQRKELLSHSADVFLPAAAQPSSPYACVAGSDSEYSAECASLFHSTVAATSEDERSDYTANCFGDSESSQDEYVEESSTGDTEESGGGGAGRAGRGRGQLPPAGGAEQEMTPMQAKAFVKIKASHNLKKKILRFRSGSLKLMTTV